jgi:hypothetical protein
MTQHLYMIVAVLLRFSGIVMILRGLYNYAGSAIVSASVRGELHMPGPLALLLPLVAGVLLWLVAKPVARLITSNL